MCGAEPHLAQLLEEDEVALHELGGLLAVQGQREAEAPGPAGQHVALHQQLVVWRGQAAARTLASPEPGGVLTGIYWDTNAANANPNAGLICASVWKRIQWSVCVCVCLCSCACVCVFVLLCVCV